MACDGSEIRNLVSILVLASVLVSSYGLDNDHTDSPRDLPEMFRSFDKNGEGRRLWLARYQNAKSHCDWEQDVESLEYDYDWFPTDQIMRGSYWSYLASQMLITTYYPEMPRWLIRLLHFFFGPAPHGPALESYSCLVTDSEGAELRIRRLGPFVGNGGFDWHKMKLQDPYKLRTHIEQGGIHVTGFMAMPVAEDGEVLGNPPIHIHHANLGPNLNRSSLSRLSQWHGDSQCSDSNGGTACYVTALPPGFGFPVSEALRLDVDFNDVRPLQSPDLKFWLETSISIAKHPTEGEKMHDVGTVILGVPFRGHWWKSSDLQRLYFVPSDQPSALWVTARMPTAGTFVAGGKIEIHQHMLDEAWVFTGVSPEDLGLNSDVWQLQKPWLPWVPSENGLTDSAAAIAALKSRVLRHFNQAVQHCKEERSCTKTPTLMWKLNRTVFEDGEERQMPWPDNTWTFEQEEQFTTVIFHKAPAMSGHDHPAEMPQHLAITGYYIPKAGTRADYWFVLPSSNADWAWINSVNWLHALTHGGGPPVNFWSWQLSVIALSFMTVCMLWCGGRIIAAKVFTDSSTEPKKDRSEKPSRFHARRRYLAIDPESEFNNESDKEHAQKDRVHDSELCVDDLA